MNWEKAFDVCYWKNTGLREENIEQFLTQWNQPLTEQEITEIMRNQRNPFPESNPLHQLYKPFDPAKWTIPDRPLPPSYLDFLRYADGGEFGNRERYFQFFSSGQLREMFLAYEFPEYMPGAVPFAMDGCGNHYIWDMRMPWKNGEYPILVSHSGNLGYEDAVIIADTFEMLCEGTTSADDILND